ncbi:MAG: hypothetical protein ACYC8T_06870 [Myxococcaceae bacterium]
MNPKPLIAFLAALALSGCVIYSRGGGNPPPALPGDVTFTWSFGGKTCSDYPQIKSVVVNIPGERLANEGVYPCIANNYPGIVLHAFQPGNYDFTLTAIGYGNEELFVDSGSFGVNGNIRVTRDLTPVGGPNSFAYLTWFFPPYGSNQTPSCEVVGITTVEVIIDGAAPLRFACANGFSQPGVQTPYLATGTHTIDLRAYDRPDQDGYLIFRKVSTLTTSGGAPVSSDYLLDYAIGGAAIGWNISEASVARTCSQAGIGTVVVNFKDSQGNWVYPAGDVENCTAEPLQYNYLSPGTYKVYVNADGAGGTKWAVQTPPTIVVTAGVFPPLSGALVVQLARVQ